VGRSSFSFFFGFFQISRFQFFFAFLAFFSISKFQNSNFFQKLNSRHSDRPLGDDAFNNKEGVQKKMASWNVSKGRKGLRKVHEHNCIYGLFIICGGSLVCRRWWSSPGHCNCDRKQQQPNGKPVTGILVSAKPSMKDRQVVVIKLLHWETTMNPPTYNLPLIYACMQRRVLKGPTSTLRNLHVSQVSTLSDLTTVPAIDVQHYVIFRRGIGKVLKILR